MEILIVIGSVSLIILMWLNFIATIAVKHDHTLDAFQKKAQLIFVWLIPYLGASFVLHMVFDHSPEAIPEKLIPWPFKKIIYGKPPKDNKHRHDAGSNNISSGYSSHDSGGGGGGD